MDRTIRSVSHIIDHKINRLWGIYREKKARLGISEEFITAVFAVPDLPDNALAMFRPEDRIITITEEVLVRGSEENSGNVFLHELAHALDWHLHRKAGHGPSFRECCRILGLPPEFSKRQVRLSIDKDNSRREKIKKLMALSSSPFENEAAEAIKKAQKLMLEGTGPAEDEYRHIYTSELYEAVRLPFWTRELAWYASRSSGVYSIIVPINGRRILTVHGSVEEIELAFYIFDYVVSAAEREIKRIRSEGRAISKGSFICGAVDVLKERTEGTAEGKALMEMSRNNEVLAKELIYRTAKISTAYARTSINRSSYDLGHDFGRSLDIRKGTERKLIKDR